MHAFNYICGMHAYIHSRIYIKKRTLYTTIGILVYRGSKLLADKRLSGEVTGSGMSSIVSLQDQLSG